MDKTILKIKDLCQILNISKAKAYKLIKSKELRSGKIGREIFVTNTDLQKYLKTQIKKNMQS